MAIGVKKYYTEEMKADIDFNTATLAEVLEEEDDIETHVHSHERWFETAAVAVGETHVADRIGSGGGAFSMDAGNDDWGSWVQLLGSSDTPAISQMTKFDFHKIQITAAERTLLYYVQVAIGEDPDTAVINNDFTEKPFLPQSVQGKPADIDLNIKRIDVTTKIWIRCKCPGQNTATLNVLTGLHEYIG